MKTQGERERTSKKEWLKGDVITVFNYVNGSCIGACDQLLYASTGERTRRNRLKQHEEFRL